MIKLLLLLFIITFIFITVTFSQDSTSKFIFTNSKDKNDSVLATFRNEQSEWFRNSEIPSFVFSGQGGRFSLGIGGYVNLTSSYDFDGIVDDIDFVTYDIRIPQVPYEKQQYQIYANTSLLYFKVIQKISEKKLIAYISANFRGIDNTFVLFQAYAKYYGFEIGQNWSSFADIASWPTTVNYLGLNSMSEVLNPLIRYSYKFTKEWEAGISLEKPNFETDFENTENIKQRVPDIPLFFRYKFGESHIRISGIYRNLLYRDTVNNENESETGAGVLLTGNIKASDSFKFYFNAIYGEGIGNYVEDLSSDKINVYPDSGNPGKLNALPVYAYFGALQYNYNQDLFASAMYSRVKAQPKNISIPDFYSNAKQFTGNIFWNFLPAAQLGVEYCFGKRTNQNGADASANRGESMLQYNF